MEPEAPAAPAVTPQPVTPVAKPLKTKKFTRQRHFLAVFFISFMWGAFGADRMYLGKWGTGILKLVTFGGLGVWVVVDLILVMGGSMRDKQGREMLQFAEYKKFAYWTVLIFALALGAFVLINGIALIVGVTDAINQFQSGGGIPGLDSLTNGSSTGLPSDLQGYY